MSVKVQFVDCSEIAVGKADEEITEFNYLAVGDKLVNIYQTFGFVYLSHHGISASLIDSAFKTTGKFFNLPQDVKEKYSREESYHGWVCSGLEGLSPNSPPDLKESYQVLVKEPIKGWPDAEVPGFRKVTDSFQDACMCLSARLLRALGYGLKLEDPNYFVKEHTSFSAATIRYHFYPPVPEDIKPGQIRCGEHTDYGSITLLFQDKMGGLQIQSKTGEWWDAEPADDVVAVNIGDMMQRWTSDRLVSNVHRVVIPEDEIKRKQTRRSIAYFVNPDKASIIACVDGSNKYEPISCDDYLKYRLSKVLLN